MEVRIPPIRRAIKTLQVKCGERFDRRFSFCRAVFHSPPPTNFPGPHRHPPAILLVSLLTAALVIFMFELRFLIFHLFIFYYYEGIELGITRLMAAGRQDSQLMAVGKAGKIVGWGG